MPSSKFNYPKDPTSKFITLGGIRVSTYQFRRDINTLFIQHNNAKKQRDLRTGLNDYVADESISRELEKEYFLYRTNAY